MEENRKKKKKDNKIIRCAESSRSEHRVEISKKTNETRDFVGTGEFQGGTRGTTQIGVFGSASLKGNRMESILLFLFHSPRMNVFSLDVSSV